jgi:hypothetical protein
MVTLELEQKARIYFFDIALADRNVFGKIVIRI